VKRKKKNEKLDLTSLDPLAQNPFAHLGSTFGVSPSKSEEKREIEKQHLAEKAQLLIRIERRKGNKTVTVIYHLDKDAEMRLKDLKRKLATGGGLDEGAVILQGDHVDSAAIFLQDLGYRIRKS